MTPPAWTNIHISPSPGFCVKSKLQHPGFLDQVELPQGFKVFVNVAWSKDLPPPPGGIKKALELATATLTGERQKVHSDDSGISLIYVFASDGRLDSDKAGNPAIVFDCIYHSSFKSHALKDADVKILLVERALQQIEVQTSFSLSRTLGTPNITSKGALEHRTISVPAALFPHDHIRSSGNSSKKRLVEEVPDNVPGVDGSGDVHQPFKGFSGLHEPPMECPTWTWKKDDQDIFIMVQVPRLTHDIVKSAILDVEPRRLTLVIPGLYALDINLNSFDSASRSPHEAERALMLKSGRDLDVDGARAEWRTKERCLVIIV